MEQILIRPATMADLDTLLQFEQGVITSERPFDETLKDDAIHYYDLQGMIASADTELVVAEHNGQIVASGYARIESSKQYHRHEKHAYLGFMYVVPSMRGKGINHQIVNYLKNWAASRNIEELRLEVYYENAPAIRAYEKTGFKRYMIEMRMGMMLCFAILALVCAKAQPAARPTPAQIAWQKLETTAFLHFTVNTFTGREWGDGTESPSIFNPAGFDADKMIRVLKETGFGMAIITAKHHDGFCLWPSAYTNHSVKASPWKNGKGDIVKEISDACRKYGIKFGFYLSPWDRNHPAYGTSDYNIYYKNQLKELLTNYGEVSEVWFDGAKGPNAKDMQYDFKGYWQLVRELQPNAVLFSDIGPDVRWVGNERGIAGETCWSSMDTIGMAPGKANEAYLNRGDKNGRLWIPAETDVSIRPGWFYHPEEDSKVRSPKNLVDLYYNSVGRNSLLLLNIPPDKTGVFSNADIENLYAFRKILNETFKTNLGKGKLKPVLTDDQLNSHIKISAGEQLEIDLGIPVSFDRISLQENIANGQKNEEALIEYWNGEEWQTLTQFTTIGHKRLLRFNEVKCAKLRLTIAKSIGPVELAEFGIFKASASE